MSTEAVVGSKKDLAAYPELLRRVREVVRAGKERALKAVERESVRTKWEVGKLVHEHVLLHKNRAEYGRQVIKRLSADLNIEDSE